MRIISVIGQKGGTGKTTLAQILAVEAETDNAVAAIVDLDPQVSACQWGDLRKADGPVIVDAQPARLAKTLDTAQAHGVTFAIIDTAGRAEQAAFAAARVADLVILPMQPTVADLKTVQATQDLLKLAGVPRHVAVLTRVKPRGSRHEETADWLREQGIPVCPVTLGDRVAYQDAYAHGLTPLEFEPRGLAAQECRQLYTFINQLLNETTRKGANHVETQSDHRRAG